MTCAEDTCLVCHSRLKELEEVFIPIYVRTLLETEPDGNMTLGEFQ